MTAQSNKNEGPSSDARLKEDLHRQLLAQLATVTGGMAPNDYLQAWWSWYLNLSKEPEKQLNLVQSAFEKTMDTWQFALQAATGKPTSSAHQDRGFSDPAWQVWPFNLYAKSYSNWAAWMQEALTAGGHGPVSDQNRLRFLTEQFLAAASPANFLHTNPELLNKTVAESGQNLLRGMQHWLEDAQSALTGRRSGGSQQFKVGQDVAVTPGKVVFRNRLIEVLQYSPRTEKVHAEPVLITPAWIMKYYILDLSPRNSLVRYLVENGHTVFMISWKNPTAVDRDLGMDDYVQLGFKDALQVVNEIVPGRKVHAVGYCIGGTLLSIGAALLGGQHDERLASITLLAALTDFAEPGELSVFISPSQLAMLEAVMSKAGVLDSSRMAAAFTMLRSRDLLWTPAVDNYIRGERSKPNDLMAWNADGTRMPWRMHSEYLDRLYLKNELAGGQFTIGGEAVDFKDIRVPMFVVGTETDHVAPWKAVYKVRQLTRSSDYTFLLTSGGHNAGIVSGPVHPKRRYRVLSWPNTTDTRTPEDWVTAAPLSHGSWWPEWQRWLAGHSAPQQQPPPRLGRPDSGELALEEAPGRYVHE
jgi:polyhydroxyalkanoate synthase